MKVVTLRKRSQFLALKAEPSRAHGAGFVLQWGQVEGEGLQVGYTASTAAIGNAVRRNRARRRLRAAFDKLVRCNPKAEAKLTGGKGLTMNWVAKAPVLDVAFEVLVADMEKALAKAGITV